MLSPEKAHALTVRALVFLSSMPGVRQLLQASWSVRNPELQKKVLGLTFKNPVGLAAGFDKDGKYLTAMPVLGFGFLELGTVTPRPQAGNPAPRLFRLPDDEALINRMGFNNEGVDALAERLKKHTRNGMVLGGNIGKNKDTPNERATEDYVYCFHALFPYVDYFVVNVSSPNTPNLRALQEKEPLIALLTALQQENNLKDATPKPILLKIAPDLTDQQLDDILDIVQQTGIAGVIATNTTISRENLQTPDTEISQIGAGGLSGAPVRDRSTAVIRYLYEKSGKQLFIIGVGGIDSPKAALEKLEAGASLIQVYSGLVYQGPGLVKSILQAIQQNKA